MEFTWRQLCIWLGENSIVGNVSKNISVVTKEYATATQINNPFLIFKQAVDPEVVRCHVPGSCEVWISMRNCTTRRILSTVIFLYSRAPWADASRGRGPTRKSSHINGTDTCVYWTSACASNAWSCCTVGRTPCGTRDTGHPPNASPLRMKDNTVYQYGHVKYLQPAHKLLNLRLSFRYLHFYTTLILQVMRS